jgi:hypothetical protein
MGVQLDWASCPKCQGMHFAGSPNKGVCPADGQQHTQTNSFDYVLRHDLPAAPNFQTEWRACSRCLVLFFGPFQGKCPLGGAHSGANSFNYGLQFHPRPIPTDPDGKPDHPNLGDPSGKGEDKPAPPNDPPPEDGPTKKGDNQEVDGTLPDPPDPPPPPQTGCFIGDTPVLMADGLTKAIDAIAVGDQVVARDEKTGFTATGAVSRIFRHRVAETLLLEMDGGEIVETTAAHRFAAEDRGFVSAGQLRPGDRLSTHSEKCAGVVSAEARPGAMTVYNLCVDRFHTFFVGSAGLWVHNVKDADPPV